MFFCHFFFLSVLNTITASSLYHTLSVFRYKNRHFIFCLDFH
ncbi:hypothetical protein HFM85_05685 [Blautia schinkii]|nr:hypothetical protein [Blautia schinkii]NSK22488.1 hypothetical protein [Blautia schinkii]NSK25530.1 hypothetical protein [Blautia schinkii]NSK31675.1 hypothetical protein [Blautia schinkii]NSK35430.1 hypothetical protein [Blautia schinkii]